MIDGVILDEFESMLDAKTGKSRSGTSITTGTVSRIDNDGSVWVRLAGASVDTPCRTTTVAVNPGDSVSVEVGGGSARVTGNISDPSAPSSRVYTVEVAVEGASRSAGAAMSASVAAEQAAREAEAVATATGQHFWYDEDGAHVTDVTQDEWNDSTGEHYHSGFNSLFNSLGMLLRRALNNLASFTRGSVAFYDGDGNDDSHITAMFGKDGAQVGAAGNPRIFITPESLSGVNPDDAIFFDIDYDGAQTLGYMYAVQDLSGLVLGVYIVGARNVHGTLYSGLDVSMAEPEYSFTTTRHEVSINFNIGKELESIESSSNCFADIVDSSNAVIYPRVDFTAGTSSSVVSETVFNTSDSLTITVSITTSYDSEAETVGAAVSISTDFSMPLRGRFILQPKVTFALPVITTAPAFALGHRTPGNDSGAYSAAIGEGIIADENHQVIVGKYNSAGMNDGLQFAVGIGTDDDNRANAFEVYDDFQHGVLVNVPGRLVVEENLDVSESIFVGDSIYAYGGLSLYDGVPFHNMFSCTSISQTIGAVAAGGTKTLTFSATRTGYRAIAISGWYMNGAAGLYPYMLRLNGTNIQCYVRNPTSSASSATAKVEVQVLYVRTGGSGDTVPAYTGEYSVTPRVYEQTLDTDGKRMLDDVTVEVIPVARVSNEQGGETATIGE